MAGAGGAERSHRARQLDGNRLVGSRGCQLSRQFDLRGVVPANYPGRLSRIIRERAVREPDHHAERLIAIDYDRTLTIEFGSHTFRAKKLARSRHAPSLED